MESLCFPLQLSLCLMWSWVPLVSAWVLEEGSSALPPGNSLFPSSPQLALLQHFTPLKRALKSPLPQMGKPSMVYKLLEVSGEGFMWGLGGVNTGEDEVPLGCGSSDGCSGTGVVMLKTKQQGKEGAEWCFALPGGYLHPPGKMQPKYPCRCAQ